MLRTALLQQQRSMLELQIEKHPIRLLCELMSGGCTSDVQFGSVEILKHKPFKPVLSKWKEREHKIVTLTSLNIDRPITKSIVETVKRHFIYPSISSYVKYCIELLSHVRQHEYYYHEIINPFLPIYTIAADVDIYDNEFVQSYYFGENQWEMKQNLFDGLKLLVKIVANDVLKVLPPIDDTNTIFLMYESIRDDLDQVSSSKLKLGIRFVVKFTTLALKNSSVVCSFLKTLEMFRGMISILAEITDEEIFDTNVYGQPAHSIRLPLNMKSDGSKALLPVFFRGQEKNVLTALKMTTSFAHSRNNTDDLTNIHYIHELQDPSEQILQRFNLDNVIKDMFVVKSKTYVDRSTIQVNQFQFTERHKEKLIKAIDFFSEGRLTRKRNTDHLKRLQTTPIQTSGTRDVYNWVSGLKFCAISEHKNPVGNPCTYYIRIKQNESNKSVRCFLYCHCFSTRCQNLVVSKCIWNFNIEIQ